MARWSPISSAFLDRTALSSSIGSIGSSRPAPTPAKTRSVHAGQASNGGKDVGNDGDQDDGTTGVVPSSTPQSTTNSLGQTIGGNLNVSG
ncbi:MAG: hypothetical protein WCH44_00585 [Betaproteobacteria bacterium]